MHVIVSLVPAPPPPTEHLAMLLWRTNVVIRHRSKPTQVGPCPNTVSLFRGMVSAILTWRFC